MLLFKSDGIIALFEIIEGNGKKVFAEESFVVFVFFGQICKIFFCKKPINLSTKTGEPQKIFPQNLRKNLISL